MTCSELVAQAGVPAAEVGGGTTAGDLPPLEEGTGVVGLAAAEVVDPDPLGWLLLEDAHPATAAAQVSAAAATASRRKGT